MHRFFTIQQFIDRFRPFLFLVWLPLSLFLIPLNSLAAKPLGTFASADNNLAVAVEVLPPQGGEDRGFVLNRMQSLVVRVMQKDRAAASILVTPISSGLTFDARMPEHNHGMVTKAKIVAVAPDEYHIEGVKLHMPGQWELTFGVKQGEQTTVNIIVPYRL